MRPCEQMGAGHPVSQSLTVVLSFRSESCYIAEPSSPARVFADSIPPLVAIYGRQIHLNHFNPKYIRTRHTTLSGVYSPGCEDGFFHFCRDAKIPIKAPGLNNRVASVRWDGADSVSVAAQLQRLAGLGEPPTSDKRSFMIWEGDLTGPQPSGHMGVAAFWFRPTRIVVAEWWVGHECRL